MKGDVYTCAHCQKKFIGAWSDEEAKAEMDANFGPVEEPVAVVCDVCYNEMIRTYPPQEYRTNILQKYPAN